MAEAASALAVLNARSLEELGRRAEALAGIHASFGEIGDRTLIPVLKARFRGFEAVLQATGQNLAALQRAEDQERFGPEAFAQQGSPNPIGYQGPARSFSSYDERQGTASIWPHADISKLKGPKGQGDRV